MSSDQLIAEVVFDRAIVAGAEADGRASGEAAGDGDTLPRFADILFASAPAWSAGLTTWGPDPRERRPVAGAAGLPGIVAAGTRWATEPARHTGNVELRGATKDLVAVVSVNTSPLARVGGKLLLSNAITVTAARNKVEGVARTEWLYSLFAGLCETLNPVWGAVRTRSEYQAKVMAEPPVLRALGRDFSRHLPGLFPLNYFGPRYTDLIGERRLGRLTAASARRLGDGWCVEVLADPFAWSTQDALARNRGAVAEIGPEFFFAKGKDSAGGETGGTGTRAPDWDE